MRWIGNIIMIRNYSVFDNSIMYVIYFYEE